MDNEKMRVGFELWTVSDAAECGMDLKFEFDTDAAAKALAESMGYPWEFMREQGRARMKANAIMVIEAAGLKVRP